MWRRAIPLLRRHALVATASTLGAGACCSCAAAPPPAAPPPPTTPSAGATKTEPPAEPTSWLPGPLLAAKESIYENVIKPYAEPSRDKLLPDIPSQVVGKEKPTLVVSLDGTLIESTWTRQYGWRYVKRPGVDVFLASLAPHYELVMWTESMNTADPVIERLDPRRFFRHRLYRDATTFTNNVHVKDLSALNRNVNKTLIIDCDEQCVSLQPSNAIVVPMYKSDDDPEKKDRELTKLIPLLQYLALSHAAGKHSDFAKAIEEYRSEGDVGATFEKWLDEQRKAGKLVLPRPGQQQRLARGPTVWDRLRSSKE